MKKAIKRTLLIVAGLFILFFGVGLIYYSPMFLMTTAETGAFSNTSIYIIKDNIGVNVYLIKTDNGYIMIDAGLNVKNIDNSLNEANINSNDIKWIFLTHSDGDHIAALTLFPNAEIYMSKDEFKLIDGTMKRNFLGGNNIPSSVNINNIMQLSNRQILLINGIKIECILAPGHTIGSMLFLIDDKYLFTGDTIKIKNGNMSIHPYSMDKNLAKATIDQIREIIGDDYIIFTSHYGIHNN